MAGQNIICQGKHERATVKVVVSAHVFLSQAIRWIAMWTWVPNGTEQKF